MTTNNVSISGAELALSERWWRNLSINQMKALESQYFPTWLSGTNMQMVHRMWEEEGRPEPQALEPT